MEKGLNSGLVKLIEGVPRVKLFCKEIGRMGTMIEWMEGRTYKEMRLVKG